jgi:hypothetical protein
MQRVYFYTVFIKQQLIGTGAVGVICPKPLRLPRGLNNTVVKMMKEPGFYTPDQVNANLGRGLLFSILVDNTIIDFGSTG